MTTWFVLQASPDDRLRQAHRARLAGHWRAATADYRRLYEAGRRDPGLVVALAELHGLRGEWNQVGELLRPHLSQPLTPNDLDQVRLLYGWSLAQDNNQAGALKQWSALGSASQGQANVLRAELALRAGQVDQAIELLNASGNLAGAWRTMAAYRAAQLSMSSAPATTLQLLNEVQRPEPLKPLPPLFPASIASSSTTLLAIAHMDPDARRVALARQWVSEDLPLAARQILATVDPVGSFAPLAGDEAARLRWNLGDAPGALEEMTLLIERFATIPALYRTQAMLAASIGDFGLAEQALMQAVQLDSSNPENFVTAAAIAVGANDYDQAGAAYNFAIATAPVSGTYQLQAAQFYATTTLRSCDDGRRYAEAAFGSKVDYAARLLAADLALRCDDPAAALTIIQPLIAAGFGDVKLRYLRGAASWRLGDQESARQDLLYVADQALGTALMRDAEALIGPP